MNRFWGSVIKPILLSLKLNKIIEIGAYKGETTIRLLDYCKNIEGNLIVIDPLPLFNVEEINQLYKGSYQLYKKTSLEVLPMINDYQAVLIDGDHNWYTVYNELKVIEKKSLFNESKFPIVFLHDTEWPYGRRDMYYNPEKIPKEFRNPYKTSGIKQGQSELARSPDAVNVQLNNAQFEGGKQNGVLTAIEDFLEETPIPLKLFRLHSNNGLGILCQIDPYEEKVIRYILNDSNL
ncbi:class I SAM-dependent methyltransferase [Bacillus hwajinpoensis]|uniref:Class I SAM-dependent methyltransferase n=1 Tax=Guptibacillus hwajinpoensis TaxID=208199 RepID=A0A845EYH9_9BACL|nr:class I SAM-dependent methyltransferase [Pseudalkalibacillus hwajinpoensis]MYL63568.1 class I SAM-dependent methyltransferase [Pseudalkalibacillus hwajinpoensis]